MLRKGFIPIEEVTTLSPLLFRDIAMNRLGPLPHTGPTLMLMPAWGTGLPGIRNPTSLPRVVPAIEVPPREWVPGRDRDAAARAEAARAAAAALPYADNRRRNLPVAAAARPRPIVPPERPRAAPVVCADRERSLPPRREPSRGPPGRPLVHPENPRYVWSFLENKWVPRDEDDSVYRERDLDFLLLDRIEICVMTPTE